MHGAIRSTSSRVFHTSDTGAGTENSFSIGGLVEMVFGIDAEGKPLEQIAAPLTVVDG